MSGPISNLRSPTSTLEFVSMNLSLCFLPGRYGLGAVVE